MAPKAIWSGTVGFAMISIPVKLYGAARDEDTSFKELHKECGGRTGRQTICKSCLDDQGKAKVLNPGEEVEKAVEISKDQYVVLTTEELQSLPLPAKDTVKIDRFVDASDIDPLWFEKTYYLAGDKSSAAKKALALLLAGMAMQNKIAIGTIAIRKKEQLCALRVSGGVLLLHTMYWPSEISTETQDAPPINEQEQGMAVSIIDMLTKPFDPSQYSNNYEAALQVLVQKKQAGEKIEVTTSKGPTTIDLTAMLAASLQALQGTPAAEPVKASKAKKKATA